MIDAGMGSTFEALERRGHIPCRHGADALDAPIVDVHLTRRGRRLVRVGSGIAPAPRLPARTLREWHARALAHAYAAGDVGLCSEGFGTSAGIGRTTWRRLLA